MVFRYLDKFQFDEQLDKLEFDGGGIRMDNNEKKKKEPRVSRMNNIRSIVIEIVNYELIYA